MLIGSNWVCWNLNWADDRKSLLLYAPRKCVKDPFQKVDRDIYTSKNVHNCTLLDFLLDRFDRSSVQFYLSFIFVYPVIFECWIHVGETFETELEIKKQCAQSSHDSWIHDHGPDAVRSELKFWNSAQEHSKNLGEFYSYLSLFFSLYRKTRRNDSLQACTAISNFLLLSSLVLRSQIHDRTWATVAALDGLTEKKTANLFTNVGQNEATKEILFRRLGWAGLARFSGRASPDDTGGPRAHVQGATGRGLDGIAAGARARGCWARPVASWHAVRAAAGYVSRGDGPGALGFGATEPYFSGQCLRHLPLFPCPPACASVSGRLSSIATIPPGRNHQKSQRRSLAGRLLHQILPTDSVTDPGYPRRCRLSCFTLLD